MSNLPVIAAIEELKESNTDNRQRLQKSMRAGMLNIVRSVQSLENTFSNFAKTFFDEQQRQAFAQLEALREAERKRNAQDAKGSDTKKAGNLVDQLGIGAPLAALAAIAASMTGFDAALKAMRVPAVLKNLANAVSRAMDFVRDVKNALFRFGSRIARLGKIIVDDFIPKIIIPDELRDAFKTQITDRVTGIKNSILRLVRWAQIWVLGSIDDFKVLVDERVTKFKSSIMRPINVVTDFFDNIKMPEFKLKIPEIPKIGFVTATGEVISDITKYMPRLELPDGLKKLAEFKIEFPSLSGEGGILSSIKNFIGFAGQGDEAGKGIVGFLSKIGDFGKMLLNLPGLKLVARVIGGPILQGFLSLIDFFVGFYKGFVGEPTFDEFGNEVQRGFVEKLLDGLEGGFLGLVKGITEGFDMLFIKLPAWLLEKLGMEDAANFLRGFSLTELVDPIWNGIKGIFEFFTNAEYRAEKVAEFKDKVTQVFWDMWDTIKEWLSGIFEFLPSMEDIKGAIYDLMPDFLKTAEVKTKTETTVAQTGVTEADIKAQKAEYGLMKMPLVSLANMDDNELSASNPELYKAKKRSEEMARLSREAIAAENAARTKALSEQSAAQSSPTSTNVVAPTNVDASQTSVVKTDTTVAVPPRADQNNWYAGNGTGERARDIARMMQTF